MRYRLAVEDIEANHYVAWVLDLPGCFSSGLSKDEAISKAAVQIARYYEWIQTKDPDLLVPIGSIEIEIGEQFKAYRSEEDPDYVVNAFFEDDKRTLSYWDAEIFLRLLTWSRQDLLKIVESLQSGVSDETVTEIHGILNHVAGAENWYLSHFALELEWSTLKDHPLERLSAVRQNTRQKLIGLIGDTKVTVRSGEIWSARKIARRTLWHERDHTQHIEQLLAKT